MMHVLGVLLGVNIQTPSAEDMETMRSEDEPEVVQQTPRSPPKPAEVKREPEPKKEPEPEPMDIPDEEKEKRERKAQALKEKELGNEFYKKKLFDEAVSHYTKALELYDEDISFLTNRAAVYLEMGQVCGCVLHVKLVSLSDIMVLENSLIDHFLSMGCHAVRELHQGL